MNQTGQGMIPYHRRVRRDPYVGLKGNLVMRWLHDEPLPDRKSASEVQISTYYEVVSTQGMSVEID